MARARRPSKKVPESLCIQLQPAGKADFGTGQALGGIPLGLRVFVFDARNCFEELRDALKAFIRFALNALVNGGFERLVDFWIVPAQGRWRTLPMSHRRDGRFALTPARPGSFKCEKLVDGNPVGEDIESLIGRPTPHDLRREVHRSASSIARLHKFLLRGHGQSKIDEREGRGILAADKIAWTHVAMNVSGGVNGFDRFGGLPRESEPV